jgi:hypothetical protein
VREFAKIAPTFWTGKTGKALKKRGANALIVAMYLMSSPHANMIGVYHCPVGYIVIDTGLSFEGASEGLASAIEVGFCTYDEASDYVFVHEFAAYQIGEELDPHDNRCKGVRAELSKLPDNECRRAFAAKYRLAFHLPPEASGAAKHEAPSKPLQSQEKKKEQEKDETQATSNEVARARRPDEPQLTLVEGGQEKPWSPPPCPHLEVLALWAEVLPALPQHEPAQWKGSRADHLRARWRETAEEKRWPDQAAGLTYFRKLFVYVGKSAFLTGRAPTRDGKRPFFVELEWLVKPLSWAKLIEGKYHSEAA